MILNKITQFADQWVDRQFRELIAGIHKVVGKEESFPVYANNAAAVAGGLTVGRLYRTGADPDLVCVVH